MSRGPRWLYGTPRAFSSVHLHPHTTPCDGDGGGWGGSCVGYIMDASAPARADPSIRDHSLPALQCVGLPVCVCVSLSHC